MASKPAFMSRHAFPQYCGLLVASLVGGACESGNLSSYLSRGQCDDRARCASGYVCDRDNWECVEKGSVLPSGGAGTAGGSFAASGTAGSAPSNGGTGAAGGGGQGGTAQTSSGGVPGTSGSTAEAAGTSASGGTSGSGGASASGGTSGSGGASASGGGGAGCLEDGCACGDGLTVCDGACLDLASDVSHCGTCDNTCAAGGVELACGTVTPGVCDCAGDDSRCGDPSALATCDAASGACRCDAALCVPGEVCQAGLDGSSQCTCDGSPACREGTVCCLGSGCVDLKRTAQHCGACGHACPALFRCSGSACTCQNDKGCDAGSPGTCSGSGQCLCGSTLCAVGQRCVAPGVCG